MKLKSPENKAYYVKAGSEAKDHVYDFTYDIVTELERCGCNHCEQLLKNTRRGNLRHMNRGTNNNE